jgi:hypothetical protein
MTNIERILANMVGGVILGGFLLCFGHQCFNFIQNQDLNDYFISSEVYDFSEDRYLLNKDINLCGKDYHVGETVDKDRYDYCINK